MIQVEKLSYGFPAKELYKNVSFTLEDGQHCAFIGSNGTGKTTLVEMIMDPEKYLYDGKILREDRDRIGYVSQFSKEEKAKQTTVFEYLSEKFVENQKKTEEICARMAVEEDLEPLFEQYQKLMDEFQSMDGDNYESNIRKQLKLIGLQDHENTEVSRLSSGEYKLLQIMKEMLLQPNLLIMDEPDAFLDFDNLKSLSDLINGHKGTLLVVTHNRYLLNTCFDKILHLEDRDIQEFDGSYIEYNNSILEKKVELQEKAAEDQAEIERTEKMVKRMTDRATKIDIASYGRALKAKKTQLARAQARQIKEPFVEIRQPKIQLPVIEAVSDETVLRVDDYQVAFNELLLENVSFELHANEKLAIVGANGTGKTTLLRDIFKGAHPAIHVAEGVELGFLSQNQGEVLNESNTIYEEFEPLGFENKKQVAAYLKDYCLEPDTLDQKINQLSGGEQNLLQVAKIALSNANVLLLDEPSSHLDIYAQLALEKAIADYQGAVLMVSHDFYNIVNCADSVLFVDDKSVRRVRMRTFRQKVYEKYFPKNYLEKEQKRKELEMKISACLKKHDIETAAKLCEQLSNTI
ncbi:ABC-F family ATP-binding cassette domain-containing protein [Frisingicoccus sp.]|uniref:ABC-F family ATP-binding cassette domain-containing protein n=1 Tax=Frisingicoccus sp. TaxID=1918627 RepID=UPI00386C7E5D